MRRQYLKIQIYIPKPFFQMRNNGLASRMSYGLWSTSCRALLPKPTKPSAVQVKLYSDLIRDKSKCVYCGDAATSTDHFRALMRPKGTPSGFCDDLWNRVPCCIICNSSKGNKPWREFMRRKTGKAPLARGVPLSSHYRRIMRLAAFERAGSKWLQRWAVRKHLDSIAYLRNHVFTTVQKHSAKVQQVKNKMKKV